MAEIASVSELELRRLIVRAAGRSARDGAAQLPCGPRRRGRVWRVGAHDVALDRPW